MSPIPRTNDADADAARGVLIERVVREVIARLRAGTTPGQLLVSQKNAGGQKNAGPRDAFANDRAIVATPNVDASTADAPVRINDRVVTAGTIAAVPSATRRIEVASNAVVTPAARDEARNREITLIRGWCGPSTSTSTTGSTSTTTSEGVTSIRGVTIGTATERVGLRDRERPERGEAVRAQLERRGVTCGAHTTIVLSDHPAAATHEEASAGRRVATVRRLTDVDRFAAELGPECWVLDMIDLSPVAAVNAARRILQTASHSQSTR